MVRTRFESVHLLVVVLVALSAAVPAWGQSTATLQGTVTDAQNAEVLSGLREGERVVVSDRSSLKAGEQVHVKEVPLLEAQE